MANTGGKIPEETRKEVKRRLDEGESPEDLADDDDLPARRTIYNIKNEMEAEENRREEMERDVFRDSTTAGRDDIIEVLELAGVGIKAGGEPKAKVEKALNAIEMDSAWDDPHYVRDIMFDEAGMTREWANRIVRKAYGRPDFPYADDERNGGGSGSQRGRGGRPGSRGGRSRGGNDRNQRRGRGGRGRGGRENQDENDQLRREMSQLRSTVSDLAESVKTVMEDGSDDEQTVKVERNGQMVEVPLSVALANGMLDDDGGSDDKDFMDKLREAKEAGIIPDPEDYKDDSSPGMMEMMATAKEAGLIPEDDDDEAIEMMGTVLDEVSQQFAQAQEATAQQMSSALEQLAEQQQEEDDDLTLEEVKALIEEERKEDKIDKLASELDRTREELSEEMKGARRHNTSPENDPEVIKHQREMDFKENQLKALNENIRTLPDQLSKGVQDGLLPLFKQMQLGAVAQQSDVWSPPEDQGRGRPGFDPEPQESTAATPEEPDATGPAPGGESGGGYPEPSDNPPAQTVPDRNAGTAQPDRSQTAERAAEVRDKLNLNDDDADAEAGA